MKETKPAVWHIRPTPAAKILRDYSLRGGIGGPYDNPQFTSISYKEAIKLKRELIDNLQKKKK